MNPALTKIMGLTGDSFPLKYYSRNLTGPSETQIVLQPLD